MLILADDKFVHERYLIHFRMPKARQFFNRFDEWTTPSGTPIQSDATGA